MSMQRLLETVAALRAENGCPWDREQNLETIKQHLVEECYEVIEAIDSGEAGRHCDELGDLLLQVVFQAQIQSEEGAFAFGDVVERLRAKLVRRHPHVFGDTTVSGSEEVLRNWEAIKASERGKSVGGEPEGANGTSVEHPPRRMPALRKAYQVQARAARLGFGRSVSGNAFSEVEARLRDLLKNVCGESGMTKEIMGDLLFALVNLGREYNVNAEDALSGAVEAFIRRFREENNTKDGVL